MLGLVKILIQVDGAGVGNARSGLDRQSMGVPVIAIGVPLVVYASTISRDTVGLIAGELGLMNNEESVKELAAKHGIGVCASLPIDPIVAMLSDEGKIEAVQMDGLEDIFAAIKALPDNYKK